VGAGLGTEAARDFLLELYHAKVTLGLIVRERHLGIRQEAQSLVLVGL
jgi:hypothetical protein